MSIFRTLTLLVMFSTSAMAESNSLNASNLSGMTATGSSVTANATLPAVSLPEEKRPFALGLGIVLVLATFHRAFARRQRA